MNDPQVEMGDYLDDLTTEGLLDFYNTDFNLFEDYEDDEDENI